MARYYNNQQGGSERELSTNWAATDTPLASYNATLQAWERWCMARYGFADPMESKALFCADMSVLYSTLCSEFDKYLVSTRFKDDYTKDKLALVICNIDSYNELAFSGNQMKDKALQLLFKVLISWCVQYGPFKTFTEKQVLDIFEEVEEESI